jgi:choline kinase
MAPPLSPGDRDELLTRSSRSIMKAIVLSAGQGRRLLPLTLTRPKCLLAIDGETTVLERQLELLAQCGISHAVVLTGFGADHVDRHLSRRPVAGVAVETLYNPFFAFSDNLATCWLARAAMDDDFLLLNGDTLFEPAVLERVLAAPPAPITVTVDHKARYDDDDMKVSLDADGRLLAIGKTLPTPSVGGEAIGLLALRSAGAKVFVAGLEQAVREQAALKRWYLSVVNDLAEHTPVETCSIRGLWWQEIDAAADLEDARTHYGRSAEGASASGSNSK